jgi:hypothetical protein
MTPASSWCQSDFERDVAISAVAVDKLPKPIEPIQPSFDCSKSALYAEPVPPSENVDIQIVELVVRRWTLINTLRQPNQPRTCIDLRKAVADLQTALGNDRAHPLSSNTVFDIHRAVTREAERLRNRSNASAPSPTPKQKVEEWAYQIEDLDFRTKYSVPKPTGNNLVRCAEGPQLLRDPTLDATSRLSSRIGEALELCLKDRAYLLASFITSHTFSLGYFWAVQSSSVDLDRAAFWWHVAALNRKDKVERPRNLETNLASLRAQIGQDRYKLAEQSARSWLQTFGIATQ